MIVAVPAMNVMAMAVDDVIDMTVVLHRVVPTLRTVDVLRIVTVANVIAVLRAHASFYGPE